MLEGDEPSYGDYETLLQPPPPAAPTAAEAAYAAYVSATATTPMQRWQPGAGMAGMAGAMSIPAPLSAAFAPPPQLPQPAAAAAAAVTGDAVDHRLDGVPKPRRNLAEALPKPVPLPLALATSQPGTRIVALPRILGPWP